MDVTTIMLPVGMCRAFSLSHCSLNFLFQEWLSLDEKLDEEEIKEEVSKHRIIKVVQYRSWCPRMICKPANSKLETESTREWDGICCGSGLELFICWKSVLKLIYLLFAHISNLRTYCRWTNETSSHLTSTIHSHFCSKMKITVVTGLHLEVNQTILCRSSPKASKL